MVIVMPVVMTILESNITIQWCIEPYKVQAVACEYCQCLNKVHACVFTHPLHNLQSQPEHPLSMVRHTAVRSMHKRSRVKTSHLLYICTCIQYILLQAHTDVQGHVGSYWATSQNLTLSYSRSANYPIP